ncbi:MAG TPA: class I SAM-dependent methyltransferase [Planctomycetota bacterium]|jgi:SAM-dependent methyltransferase|nr:class I SAM-dependent methyltransferase [Planctomycetota bacterium]
MTGIQPHNRGAAATWDAGGRGYDRISATIADSIEHAVLRLDPKRGERVLDVATGTGWAARRCAARGASVVGVDLGAELVAAAAALTKDAGVEFRVADAEGLPFEEGSFDAVLSTFGVMFASRPDAAAGELARVCRRGGRVAVAAWTPDSTVAGLFQVMRPYRKPPSPAPPSPFEWGRRERVSELLGGAFDLRFEEGTSPLREPSGEAVWHLFRAGYGPTKSLFESLDAARQEALQRDFVAFHEGFRTELGIAMPRHYLLAVGVRR